MPVKATILLASPDPGLLRTFEPQLAATFGHVQVVLSAEAARAALLAAPLPNLALLDATLPGIEMGQLLAAVRAEPANGSFPIVLISDTVNEEWLARLAEGVVDDLLPRNMAPEFLQPRLQTVLRARKAAFEMELLHEATDLNRQIDRLTGIYNRDAMLGMLFRETDRVQRMKSELCVVLFDVDDFGHWNSRLGTEICDELLRQVTARTTRLLRSYDLLGRVGKDEFLVALPGCTNMNATVFAERLRSDVFSTPFHLEGESIRLSACFGVASSQGRSPVVVLREAEMALQTAKMAGPESIEYYNESSRLACGPVTFLSPSTGDELIAW